MVADVRAWGLLVALGLIAAEPVLAQSSGPSTTGGALPYVVGPSKPTAPAEPPAANAPDGGDARPATGVRVIDLSKREGDRAGERPVAAPAIAPAPSPTGTPSVVARPVPAPPSSPVVAAPSVTTEIAKPILTPPPPAGADLIAATPPLVDGLTKTTEPRPLADLTKPKPKAKPKARVAATKPPPVKRAPTATTRLERFDQDVEVEIETPRRPRGGRLAGYDAWGRPIYYMPNTPGRDRRVARGPIEVEDEWIEAPPARLRPLPPLGVLRPFPPRGLPGSFQGEDCRVVFYTDEIGRTRREVDCR